VVETAALAKSFGDVEAVRGVDLSVPAHSIFGFLGPNRAGKTTTIKMLVGCCAQRPAPPRCSAWMPQPSRWRCAAASGSCPSSRCSTTT
jgi:ABC-type uncharacterized transport system ATPase subunit